MRFMCANRISTFCVPDGIVRTLRSWPVRGRHLGHPHADREESAASACWGALIFKRANITVSLKGAIAQRTAVDDCSGGVQQLSTRTDIDVALSIEDKVGAAEGAIRTRRVSHTGMCGAILRSTNHLSSLAAP